MSVIYSMITNSPKHNGNTVIFRDGVEVAIVNSTGVVPALGMERFQHRATRYYKEQMNPTLDPIPAGDSLVTDVMDEQKEEEPTPTDVRPPLFGRLTTPTKHSLPDDFPEELLGLEGGDKHPDFVRYLKTNHPDLAAKRYHGRIIPTE